MLTCKISKRAQRKMICHLRSLLICPSGGEKIPALQCPRSMISFRISSFCSSIPVGGQRVAAADSRPSVSVSVNRISRVARNEAQAALFDYLHSTRGLTYTDAEHMSRNSPHFVESLLSRVENEQDVLKALSKFFRFCPINEFEPFLESLGLSQLELMPLLPRDLIYLSDDRVLLGNFHVLCDYGVPRTEIGKMYKEVTEIFRYEYGKLEMKLRAYEKLDLSKPTVIKLVTCCPSVLVGDVNEDLVGVLGKLKALGFETDWIGGYLMSKHTYSWTRMLDTMTFLAEVGYGRMQLGDLIRRNPALLFEGSGKQIYVLVGRLLKLGLKMSEVYSLFLENPEILSPKCTKNLWNAVYFLLEIGMEMDSIAKIISSHLQLLGSHSLKGPKTVLRNMDGDRQRLCQIIKENPLNLFTLASKSTVSGIKQIGSQTPSNHLEKTSFLLKLGYIENSDEMAKALKQFRGRGDQLQERFDCLVQGGLDCNIVSDMIKQAPTVLNQSKNVLEKKIAFLKSSGYPMESIVAFPSYLCYDMGRIERRFSMYMWLKERGAAKPMLSVSTLLACADARFVKYFVDIHPEGPAKWESLKKCLLSS